MKKRQKLGDAPARAQGEEEEEEEEEERKGRKPKDDEEVGKERRER